MLNLDFDINPKQSSYMEEALAVVTGNSDVRHLFYGGAIRGGKSYVSLAILAIAARAYDGSRWHVFRRDMPALTHTTIPSMEKVLGNDPDWRWHRDKSDYYVECISSKGRIYFKAESLAHDPELNDLLGLETNGILFEQIEELSEKLYQMGVSRIGSHYIDKMPYPFTLATFNPTQTWIKERIYAPWVKGELAAPYYYMNALPTDNAYVTRQQWALWEGLDERYVKQYIQGDWTDFAGREGLWAFSYQPEKHLVMPEIEADKRYPLYISFDFNRNPICCSVIQCVEGQIRVIETIKLRDSNIYLLCNHILVRYPAYMFIVTGDATGWHSNGMVKDHNDYYKIIKNLLGVPDRQIRVPLSNPHISDNQVLINSILSRGDVRINPHRAAALAYDLSHVKMYPDGTIIKADRTDPAQQADALDTFRYYCNVFHADRLLS